jgi:hypothetical protein
MPDLGLNLSIFDHSVNLVTDSNPYSELIKKTYKHFITDETDTHSLIPFHVSFYKSKSSGKSDFQINGKEILIKDPKFLRSEYVHGIIFSSLYASVRSHYLFHAASLSMRREGVILLADSGFGKTTLTLALIKRGFCFLSDEIAAIGVDDNLLYPFPRGIHIRQHSLKLLDITSEISNSCQWFGKLLVDIDDLYPGMIGEPARLKHIVILKKPQLQEIKSQNSNKFKVILNEINPSFLQKVKQLAGLNQVQVGEEDGFPCLILDTFNRIKVIASFEYLCSTEGIMVLDLIKRENESVDFSQPVRYQKISTSQAAYELLPSFLGGHKSPLVISQNNLNATGFFMKLIDCLENTNCYQITVGPLHEMIDVITNLVNQDSVTPHRNKVVI